MGESEGCSMIKTDYILIPKKSVKFWDIEPGTAFIYLNMAFLKTGEYLEEEYEDCYSDVNAVRLADGNMTYFKGEEEVEIITKVTLEKNA